MEGPISFWGYKEQESNLILPEHDDDNDDKNHVCETSSDEYYSYQVRENQSNYAKVKMMGHAQSRTQKLAKAVIEHDLKSHLTSH